MAVGQAQEAENGEKTASGLKVGDSLDELGHTFERPGESSLNLRIVDNNFRLYFLDEEGKIMEPDRDLGALRYDPRREDPEFLRLSPAEEKPYLTHVRYIRRPYVIRIHLVLQNEGDPEVDTDKNQEIYNFMFRQD